MSERAFADWASIYRNAGFWPRPVVPGTKACKIRSWQVPDPELHASTIAAWPGVYADYGIGLLLGSPTPDDSVLGALDIDRDDYVRVAATLLRHPICGRIGARGAAYLVRVRGDTSYRDLCVSDDSGSKKTKIGELLVTGRLLVIPPTIHPDTRKPYRWIGPPLHEIDLRSLPLLERPI